MPKATQRFELLVGSDAVRRLKDKRVAVFGLGGVGGSLAEALARAGVGRLDLVDDDVFTETNLNRQLFAVSSAVGQKKTAVAKKRLLDVCPACVVTTHDMFYLPETADAIDLRQYDYVADAIDTVSAKLELICRAKAAGVPILSCMGTGNRLDPTKLTVCDVYKTAGDPLSRVMRRELRKRGVPSLTVVCSDEEPIPRHETDDPPETKGNLSRPAPGSSPFVPPAAGLLMASVIVRELIK